MRHLTALSALLLLVSWTSLGQSYRSTVNEGNELYNKKQYEKAVELYERAAVENPERMESYFNRGNAAYRNNDVKAALDAYEKAGKRVQGAEQLGNTMYNAGNVFLNAAEQGDGAAAMQAQAGDDARKLRMEGYTQAIGMYKRALKINPNDSDARYNLTYAKKKLEEMKQQNNQNDQQKQQKQDKDKDDKNKDKDQQDKQDKQDKQDDQNQKRQNQKDKQDNKEKAKPDEQEQSQPEKKHNMSKQQAERILNALEQDEKDLQKKKRQKVNARVQVEKDW